MPEKKLSTKERIQFRKLFLKSFVRNIANQFEIPSSSSPMRRIPFKKSPTAKPRLIQTTTPQPEGYQTLQTQPIQPQKELITTQIKQMESRDLKNYMPSIQYGDQSADISPVPAPLNKKSPMEIISGLKPQDPKESPMEILEDLEPLSSPALSPSEVLQNLEPLPPPPPPPPQIPAIDRLLNMLQDPSVLSVEAPGAGKNLILNKSGMMSIIQDTFTSDDINDIMEYFSEETRIPLAEGIFRAAYQNLLITAVLSEFGGSRFHIGKRAPPRR